MRQSEILENSITLTGAEFCALLRRHRVTIREFAARTQITLRRIREVRRHGPRVALRGLVVHDWIEAITGEFTPQMRAQMRQIINLRTEEGFRNV